VLDHQNPVVLKNFNHQFVTSSTSTETKTFSS